MHKLYDLKEKLIKELEGYADNGKYSKEDVEVIKYMASAVDHICNIVEDMDEGEYSGNMYYDDGMGGGSMRSYRGGRGGSYARRGGSYEGSYARGRGRGARRDAMGRYSREGGSMVEQLEDLMEDAPDEKIRQEMQKFITKIEQMM